MIRAAAGSGLQGQTSGGGGNGGSKGGGGGGSSGDGHGEGPADGQPDKQSPPAKSGLLKGWEERVAFDPELPVKVALEQVDAQSPNLFETTTLIGYCSINRPLRPSLLLASGVGCGSLCCWGHELKAQLGPFGA